MNILMIVGDSIYADSSTNIFKRRIIDEIARTNNLVVLMGNNSANIKQVIQYEDNGVTFIEYSRLLPFDRIIELFIRRRGANKGNTTKIKSTKSNSIKELLKRNYNKLYSKHIEIFYKKYRYDSAWLQRAKIYKSNINFDVVMSISHPPVSHKVALDLILSKNIKCKKWIQIWFEPWFQVPLKKNKTGLIIEEEKILLNKADSIFYVNLVFLNNQKKMFPEYAKRMHYIDLPVVFKENPKGVTNSVKHGTVGYFGNYNSSIRNIQPLYNAIREMDNVKGYIIGDSDLSLKTTNKLVVKSRVSYEDIKEYEKEVEILIILSNFADQIPGKIYDYSCSNKYILFILDGSIKSDMKEYFGRFNRYIFCENKEEDIKSTIIDILDGKYLDIKNEPIQKFYVQKVVNKIFSSFSEE